MRISPSEIFLSLLVIVLFKGSESNQFPAFFGSRPPYNFFDCLYRYFSCTDDKKFGEWPMNEGVCHKEYSVCNAEMRWNRQVVKVGPISITYPKKNPVYFSEQDGKISSQVIGYLHNYAYVQIICENQEATLSCQGDGRIKLVHVFYGRKKQDICPVNVPGHKNPDNCLVEDALEPIFLKCEGRTSCKVSTRILNAHYCYDQFPYLKIKYTCTGFRRPDVITRPPSPDSKNATDKDINTMFMTRYAQFPWLYLSFDKNRRVKEVHVFAKDVEGSVDLSTIKVKFAESQRELTPPFRMDENNCFKRGPWSLIFHCNAKDTHRGVIIYSEQRGIISVREVVIILEHSRDGGGDDGDDEKPPYTRSPNNIYVIIDEYCSSDATTLTCYNYGGEIISINYFIGRTRGPCRLENPELECIEEHHSIIPSCLKVRACIPSADSNFRQVLQSLAPQQKCQNPNYYKYHYTCTGLPTPQLSASSVMSPFSLENLLYEERFPTSYYQSRPEASPWIQVYFKLHLPVYGIQFTTQYGNGPENFRNILVRVGKHAVVNNRDLSLNPECGRFPGPLRPDQKYVVVLCGSNSFLVGDRLTIQKLEPGVLQIRDIVILLKPEKPKDFELHYNGFLIEELFCGDFASLTCEHLGQGKIMIEKSYAGSNEDPNVCNPKMNLVEITSECEISETPFVRNNCEGQRKCEVNFSGRRTCVKPISFRRILYRCSNFVKPKVRSSSFENQNTHPNFAIDGKVRSVGKFIFVSQLENNPWIEMDFGGVYIVQGVEIIFGPPRDRYENIEISIRRSPTVPNEDSSNGDGDYDYDFFRVNEGNNTNALVNPRASGEICARIPRTKNLFKSQIKCLRNISGQYLVIRILTFARLIVNEFVALLADK